MKSVGDRLLSSQSPFLVQKLLDSVGKMDEVKKLRTGDFLLKVSSVKMSRKLQHLRTLGDFKVHTEPHKSLNHVKGVIFHYDLAKSSSEEVISNLESYGVTDAYCVTKKFIDGETRKTGLIILTFKLPEVPKEILAGYLKLEVRPYIPNPMRCYKCCKLGHLSSTCSSRVDICGLCGQEKHLEEGCPNDPHCVNCGGDHPSNNRDCPAWKAEKEIQKIKVMRDMPYREAKKIYEIETAQTKPYSVAAAAAPEKDAGHELIKQLMAKLVNLEKKFDQLAKSTRAPVQPTPTTVKPKTITSSQGEQVKDPREKEKNLKRVNSGSPLREKPTDKVVKIDHVQSGDKNIPPNLNHNKNKQKWLKDQGTHDIKLNVKGKNGSSSRKK